MVATTDEEAGKRQSSLTCGLAGSCSLPGHGGAMGGPWWGHGRAMASQGCHGEEEGEEEGAVLWGAGQGMAWRGVEVLVGRVRTCYLPSGVAFCCRGAELGTRIATGAPPPSSLVEDSCLPVAP